MSTDKHVCDDAMVGHAAYHLSVCPASGPSWRSLKQVQADINLPPGLLYLVGLHVEKDG